MDVKIDLSKDWLEYLRFKISEAGYPVDENESLERVSYKFFNIDRRRIIPLPRTVYESKNISCEAEHQAGYNALKQKLVNGEDVTPHLSKTILSEDYEDGMLNDWGIHHFHLGEVVEDGFVERTGPLLFVRVVESEVYCISILAHGAWTEQGLIKTLHDEWPESIDDYLLKGILDLSFHPTNEDVVSAVG